MGAKGCPRASREGRLRTGCTGGGQGSTCWLLWLGALEGEDSKGVPGEHPHIRTRQVCQCLGLCGSPLLPPPWGVSNLYPWLREQWPRGQPSSLESLGIWRVGPVLPRPPGQLAPRELRSGSSNKGGSEPPQHTSEGPTFEPGDVPPPHVAVAPQSCPQSQGPLSPPVLTQMLGGRHRRGALRCLARLCL